MATLRQTFSDIASAIRAKGVSGSFKPIDMASKIGEIRSLDGYGYLTFTAEEATTLTLMQNGAIAPLKLLKSTDGVNWTKWENPDTNTISLSSGQSVHIKAADDASHRTAIGLATYNKLVMTGKIQVSGDIISIVKLIAPAYYGYWMENLFYGCSSLTTAPELPTTNLTNYCYQGLFRDCTSLTTAPELPATNMDSYCYSLMFYGCSSLTTAPELPATNMETNCYFKMFYGCTSLKRIKMNASSGSWGQNMLYGCTSLELVDMTGSTGVPTLSSVNNFDNTNNTYKIVVPDSLYDEWIAATNWASNSIKPHIMKKSDWNAAHPDDQL